jgi:hypothetical protein
MIKYLKEISTQIIYKFQQSESPAFPELFEPATEAEILNIELTEVKQIKIKQLKNNRDIRLLKSMTCVKAFEVLFDEFGLDIITENEVFFEFKVTSTGQPATEPNSLLLNCILKNNEDYIRYSCIIIEVDNKRKGYVKLDAIVAKNLINHIETRNTNYIKLANDLENQINQCSTIEEVENIDIDFN